MTIPTRFRAARICAGLLLAAALTPAAHAVDVRICTSEGIVDVELDERNAPRHARNFIRYAESGFYSGTVIHRVVPDTMVQAGSYDLALERRRPAEPVANEAGNGLSNRRGTLAASRGEDPDSATSQFFVNLADNTHLDGSAGMPGYTVFGRVTGGLEVLDRISRLPTRARGELAELPVPLVTIDSVTLRERPALFGLSVEPDPAELRADFDAAVAGDDAAATLAAVDALRGACLTLGGDEYLAEAESALALGRTDRARYSLEQYLAEAGPLDPLVPRAQRLYAGLPAPARSDIEASIAHCQRPAVPTLPDPRFADLGTMRAAESMMRQYRQRAERYANCVAAVIDSGALSEAQAIDATKRHNEVVTELTATIMRFNDAVEDFEGTR